MSGRTTLCLVLTVALLVPGVARAQHGSLGGGGGGHAGGGMHHGGMHHPGHGGPALAAVGGGYAGYWFGWPYVGGGPGFYYPYYSPMLMAGPGGFAAPFGALPPPMPMRGPLLPPPPLGFGAQQPGPAPAQPQAAKPGASDPSRSAHLIKLGDGLFRAGNLKKAEERYLQASKAETNKAAPHLRLALIALARGRYSEAAARLRDAETAEPGWVITAPDVQSIYGEPAAFQRQVGRLESYVQSHPDDRDAWLVLGAEWFLSGRTTRAADVFLRLDDPHRRPDVALAAFLFASEHAKLRPAGKSTETTH
jgi:tetratricopeptide (TPR) repeat protein